MIRSWVTLVGALVALVVILATHFLGEAAGDFLAPLIFWLPVVALLLVIAAAVTSLAQDSSAAAGAGPPRALDRTGRGVRRRDRRARPAHRRLRRAPPGAGRTRHVAPRRGTGAFGCRGNRG